MFPSVLEMQASSNRMGTYRMRQRAQVAQYSCDRRRGTPWLNSNDVIKVAWKKYNLSLGIGLGKVAGKIFRIGHLGYVDEVR